MTQGKKRLTALLLAAVMMGAAACGAPAPSAKAEDGEKSVSPSSASVSAPEDETPEDDTPEGYYPYTLLGSNLLLKSGSWEPDGSFTFQNENTRTTLTPENALRETVTLPEEELPQGYYTLTWSGSYILAIGEGEGIGGIAYLGEDGGVHLANVTLFNRQGKMVRQYMPVPSSGQVIDLAGLTNEGGNAVHWLDDETIVICGRSRILLYNFATDLGRVLDDMSYLEEKHNKFFVYYGVDLRQCGALDGSFYYMTRRTEEESIHGGTIWRANKDGAAELFDGGKFWHFFVGNQILAAVAHPSSDGNAPDVVYSIEPGTLEPREVWQGNFYPPFAESGPFLAFAESGWQDDIFSSVVHAYRRDTGEFFSYGLGAGDVRKLLLREAGGSLWLYYTLFRDGDYTDWAYDTAAGTAMELPAGSIENILSVSPDGSRIVQAGMIQKRPWLRVSPWEF